MNNINNYGLQEMSTSEFQLVNGGSEVSDWIVRSAGKAWGTLCNGIEWLAQADQTNASNYILFSK